MSRGQSWHFHEGDAITPQLTAMRLLGGGTTYEAYLAFDEIVYAPAVVKVVRPDRTTDEGSLKGLRREIDVLGTVNHPGVVRMLRAEVDTERPLVVLEHVEGPRLSSLIRRFGPLQPQQYLPLVVDLTSALHYFAHLRLVHLDIKPSNIIMGSPARLIDLSVARAVDRARQLTVQVGTDAYMSPEQVEPEGAHRPGFESDVWGVGVTLYEAVTGERAFPQPERIGEGDQVYPQMTSARPTLPRQVPAAVAEVIEMSMRHDPAQRPTPEQLSEALEPLLAALPQPKLTFKVRL